jgi:hypothetical protein
MAKLLAAALVLLFAAEATHAGSVITTNLPANTAIINISGTQDGAATYDGSQDKWYGPFSASGAAALLKYTIQPGAYTFKITNPTLAASQFPSLTSTQLSTINTAWTYNSPWIEDYMVWDNAAATDGSIPQLFSGAITPLSDYPGYPNPTTAFNTAETKGFANQIVDSPGGRFTGTVKSQRSFPVAQTLIFAVPDPGLGDNAGGVSVVIAPTTGPLGDYNQNGTVDAADFARWRKNFGSPTALPNDDTAGVGNDDYTRWRTRFGQTAGAGTALQPTAVPEPDTCLLLLLTVAATITNRRHD